MTDSKGNRFWLDAGGYFHRRNDLPAIVWADGTHEWFVHGIRHRIYEDSPAVVRADGSKLWVDAEGRPRVSPNAAESAVQSVSADHRPATTEKAYRKVLDLWSLAPWWTGGS